MLKDEIEPLPVTVRRERMLQTIAEREFVRVADLSEEFGISDVTVRADLAALALRHSVRRVRGGAMVLPKNETSFEEALVSHAVEKQRIGERAAAMVTSGMSVLLDVGTTTTAVARALVARSELEGVVVITNGLGIALELEPALSRFTVVVTGGTLRSLQHSLVDPMATVMLDRVHADLAFIGCNGIDVEHGVTNVNLPEAEVKARMISSATRVVVVADGSKLGQVHLGRVAEVHEVHTVITGPRAASGQVGRLREAGLDVIQTE